MKTYDSYKDSNIEWTGEIPSHWREISIKWICKIFSGGTPSKNIDEYWLNGTIPWLNSGSVNQGFITEASEYISEIGFQNSSAKWIPKNALVIALAGQGKTKGTVAQLGFEATCNQSMAAIIPQKDLNPRFLLYWLQSNYQNIRNLGGGDLRDGLNLEMIGSIKSPIPIEKEQSAIASYLDQKTAEIEELIADKKRLLELYEEEKTAVINQAVTKGINPDAPMKDSGIEWLGEIPEHWDMKKLKLLLKSVVGGGTPSTSNPLFWDGDIPWVSAKDMKSDFIYSSEDYITRLAVEQSSTHYFENERVIIVVRSGILKHSFPVAINKVPICINQDLKAIEPTEILTNDFLFWKLKGQA
nr:restriction endonuclease subunit S [Algoriphagus sp.]